MSVCVKKRVITGKTLVTDNYFEVVYASGIRLSLSTLTPPKASPGSGSVRCFRWPSGFGSVLQNGFAFVNWISIRDGKTVSFFLRIFWPTGSGSAF